jgi:DNA-binding MarR family transcriptional regulator
VISAFSHKLDPFPPIDARSGKVRPHCRRSDIRHRVEIALKIDRIRPFLGRLTKVSMEIRSSGSTVDPTTSVKPAPALEAHLGYWVRLVSNHISGTCARALQEQGLSVAEWVALNQIGRGTILSPAGLADVMGMTRGAISKVLDKLQSKEWISCATSQEDNRVQLLAVTRQGKRVLPELTTIADGNDEHFFGVLDATERATLQKLLKKLADAQQMHKIPVD